MKEEQMKSKQIDAVKKGCLNTMVQHPSVNWKLL